MAYQLVEEPQFIRLSFSGTITLQNLRDALAELETIETSRSVTPHRLTDLTGVEQSEILTEGIGGVAARRKARRFPNHFRSALVAPRAAQFGYARMFQILNEHPDITVRVFSNLSEATAWLASSNNVPSTLGKNPETHHEQ